MLKRWSLLVILMLALVAFTGCSDDDDPTTPPTTGTAFEVMVAAGKAYINDSAQCPGVLSAAALHDNLDDYTVIDIRSADAYNAGHIPGAYSSPGFSTLLDDLANNIPSDKPYVLTCYSGQSAGHAKIAMEMMGYDNVYSLLFGMCSWNEATRGSWDGNVNNLLSNPEQTNNNGDLVEHDFPTLEEDASTVVADRVNAMLAAGFQGIGFGTIQDNLDDYFIINYFSEADYLGEGASGVPGHIPGAFQFTPYASLGEDQMLNNLPTDQTIIVYCWTGQHSSQVTAYLNMLGYTAKSLSFGSNALFHDDLTAHKWTEAAYNDFDMVMGPEMTGDFAALVEAGADYINDGGDCPGVISAQALYDNLTDYTVIDIRGADDFNNGHIAGAVNVALADLPTALTDGTIPTGKPYVVACYTGQAAGHAKFAMEMLGYEDTKSLLWGMSSWSSDVTGTSWATSPMVADALGAAGAEQTNNNGDLTWGDYPATTGDVATRVQAVLDGGFKGITYTAIQDYLDDYFVINYFGEADYLGEGTSGVPGHIPGAFQFTPYASLGVGEMLANLPTDKTIVVYCWTGQHSSQVTAYLNYLGYDAKSLVYGSNNLFHSSLTGHAWSSANVMDFPLETTTF
jgi:rhodanese-related sulfurtransferase